jgi:hypothetical protein
MALNRQQLFALAHQLGHQNPEIQQRTNGKFYALCSCGYESVGRLTFKLALEAGIHHALSTARTYEQQKRQHGSRVSLPKNVVGAR